MLQRRLFAEVAEGRDQRLIKGLDHEKFLSAATMTAVAQANVVVYPGVVTAIVRAGDGRMSVMRLDEVPMHWTIMMPLPT